MYNISCFVCLYFFANVPYEPENLSNYNDEIFFCMKYQKVTIIQTKTLLLFLAGIIKPIL